MRLIKLFILFILLACEACQNDEKVRNDGYIEYEDGSEFLILKLNESCIVTNDNNSITVSFASVIDNRSPMGRCYLSYGSSADIYLSISDSEGNEANIDLGIWGCMYEVIGDGDIYYSIDTLGYRFQLFKLSPYPDSIPINKNDYTAKIKITKL